MKVRRQITLPVLLLVQLSISKVAEAISRARLYVKVLASESLQSLLELAGCSRIVSSNLARRLAVLVPASTGARPSGALEIFLRPDVVVIERFFLDLDGPAPMSI